MEDDKYFERKTLILGGKKTVAWVPKKMTPKEREKVHKDLLEDIKLIAQASQRRKSS